MTHEIPIKDVIKTLKEIKDGQVLFYKKEALEIAIELLSTNKSEWISVSERLPEDGDYLVTIESIDGTLRINMRSFAKDLNKVDKFDFSKHKSGWYDYDTEYGYWEDTRVIAWMPLPEPYKAE